MKKYNVNVNGTAYEVTVEEVVGGAAPAPVAAAPAAAPAPAPVAAPAGAGEQVKSPMPGNILSVNVNVGDTVAEGQVLMILEAMKMENEIFTTVAGSVSQICCKEGDTVSTGDTLLVVA